MTHDYGVCMSSNPKVQAAVEWYSKNSFLYEALAGRVESIIREVLELRKINYHSITSRPKSIESYQRKASMEKYKEPRSEIMDMAGIRVITYTDSDAKEVYEIVKSIFDIQPELSVDKSKELGINRVGYRSIHCIGTLGEDRLRLPEYKIFKDVCFEIQIRTILQHAWAEFEHDRNYKFSGVLPEEIRRRFSILAGNLELIDREFDSISEAIDAYAEEVGRKTELGDLDVPINSTSLKEYMSRKFEDLTDAIQTLKEDKGIIEQIQDMGINTLQEFDKIIPKDYIDIKTKHMSPREPDNFYSIIVDILIIHDADTYFKKAWKGKWEMTGKSDIPVFKHYGIDFEEYAKRHGIEIYDDS